MPCELEIELANSLIDINECFEMTDDCSENAKCVNTKGSFEFVCKPGYTGDGRSCEGIIDICYNNCNNLYLNHTKREKRVINTVH